jgi:hypothetical protein
MKLQKIVWLGLACALSALTGCASERDASDRPETPQALGESSFLEPSEYQTLIGLGAEFPFGVTAKHQADASVTGSTWGRHGGPTVTSGTYGSEAPPVVTRWTFPADRRAAASKTASGFATADGLPEKYFYGPGGMVDLPFGNLSLLAYTGFGTSFPGEALLYNEGLDRISSRAKVNGFYSGVGLVDGPRQRIVYSGLSPLSASPSATQDNGLYTADLCDDELVASHGCAPSQRLFGWRGSSGPVVSDTHGNVFVAAALRNAFATDAVYGLTKVQAMGTGAQEPTAVAYVNTGGTSSLAASGPRAGTEGWLVARGYDEASPFYATSYAEQKGLVAIGSAFVDQAITKGSDAVALSVFADAEGDLWVAVATAESGYYLELSPRK